MLGFTALSHIDLPVHPDAHRCPVEDSVGTVSGVSGEIIDPTTATAAVATDCFKNETQNAEFNKEYRKAHNIMVVCNTYLACAVLLQKKFVLASKKLTHFFSHSLGSHLHYYF